MQEEVTDLVIRIVMSLFKILTHPFLLIAIFISIIICGESSAGFYISYLTMGLFIGAAHSFLGIIGIIFLLRSYSQNANNYGKYLSNLTGCTLLLLSVYFFFYSDKSNYNRETFHEIVPLIILTIFGSLSILFLLKNFFLMVELHKNKIRNK